MKLNRNFPCSCGSGKKFKNCCGSKKSRQGEILFKKGIAHYERGRLDEAAAIFQRVLSFNPRNIQAHIHLGVIYDRNGLLNEAISCFNNAVSLNSKNPVALYNLGVIYYKKQHYENAIKHFNLVLSIDPHYPNAHFNLGQAHCRMDNPEDAIANFNKQLTNNPEFLIPHVHLATIHERRNDLLKARHHTYEARKGKDTKIASFYLEARILYREDDLQGALEQLAFIPEPNHTPQINNLYGKIYDRIGEVDKAFDSFTKANTASLETPHAANTMPAKRLNDVLELNKKYSTGWVSSWTNISPQENYKPSPVFLVGFPRSGTTLLDQILSTHNDLEVLEEMPMLEVMVKQNPSLNELSSDSLAQLSENDIINLQKEYYELASPFLPEDIKNKIVIDKFPLNIIKIGLINRIFPESKIIFAMRHPMDVCLSNFMQNYKLNDAMANFATLEGTAIMYKAVMDLWLLYTEALNINSHTVKYENLVESLELETRKLFAFLSVPWDENVLSYYKHTEKRKTIKTPSYQDISKPIFTRARYRWKRYEKYLKPVKELLIPYVEHFEYDLK